MTSFLLKCKKKKSETSFFQCVKNIVKERKYQTLKMTLNYPSTML